MQPTPLPVAADLLTALAESFARQVLPAWLPRNSLSIIQHLETRQSYQLLLALYLILCLSLQFLLGPKGSHTVGLQTLRLLLGSPPLFLQLEGLLNLLRELCREHGVNCSDSQARNEPQPFHSHPK